jgi:hypothetical protein
MINISWAATAMAAASLVLVAVNAALVLSNQASQAEVAQRQQLINQGAELMRLEQAVAGALSSVATESKDEALNALLARYGLPPQAAAPSPADLRTKQ